TTGAFANARLPSTPTCASVEPFPTSQPVGGLGPPAPLPVPPVPPVPPVVPPVVGGGGGVSLRQPAAASARTPRKTKEIRICLLEDNSRAMSQSQTQTGARRSVSGTTVNSRELQVKH